MSIVNKLLLLALVLAVASPFVMKKPDGTPFMQVSELLEPAKKLTQAVVPGSSSKSLYRWQDASGNWQYSDTPPDNANAQAIKVEDKINSMKTIDLPEGYQEKQNTTPSDGSQKRFDPTAEDDSGLSLTTAPLEKVPEMLDQIKDFQKSLDDRKAKLDNM